MPRGRPPGSKNKNSQQKQSLFAENTEVNVKQTAAEPVANPVVKNLERFPKCMLCGNPIISDFRRVQLTAFTGQAYWHRDIPDMIRMCGKCSTEFSDVVQEWLIKHGAPMRLGYHDEELDNE